MTVRPPFRNDLEGLRGIAILLVVLFHAGVVGFGGGFAGVDVFFVLSGFLVTSGLRGELKETGSISLSDFWDRRMVRLAPALLVVIVATLAIAFTLYAPIDRGDVAGFSRLAALYAGNLDLAMKSRDYFATSGNPLLHTWSLGVEGQFYLIWPPALLALWRLADAKGSADRTTVAGLAVIALGSFAASVIVTPQSQPWAFFGPLTRLWEFALGGLIGMIAVEWRCGWVGGALVVLAVVLYDDGTLYPSYAAALPAIGASLIILDAGRSRSLSRLLSGGALRWFGDVSYCWYLWHWPLIELGKVLDPQIGAVGKITWSLLGLVLAVLTTRAIERTIGKARQHSDGAETLALRLTVATAVLVLCTHVAMLYANREMHTGIQARFAGARDDRMTHDCWATTIDDPKGPCEFGDRSSSRTIALLGDSHAEHWLGALDRAGRERGWKILARVKGGCPVSDAPEMNHPRRIRHYAECTRYRDESIREIIRMRPAAVILSSWDHYLATEGRGALWQVTPSEWEAGLRRTYSRFAAARIPMIVMRDVPETPFDVPRCHSRRAARLAFASDCTYERAKSVMPTGIAAQNRAAQGLDVRFVNMNDLICPSERCSPVRGGIVAFTDDNHITASFSRSLAAPLADRIGMVSRRP
jgi:peptidoglycan/LPS O-acetylase OafA/YrhL